ncbi:cholesterol oxidase substrate-binding domain-containing protein [Pendulispora albinea]|uniref:FAD-binding protein n=1 Tax=Pendulispora albinea TaxID=2741071 RepID=A0ABZ2LSG4_9BACT
MTQRNVSRRLLLRGAASAAALGALHWTPAFRIAVASAASTIAAPPNALQGISIYQQAFRNWSGEIALDGLWTAAPSSPDDVVALANWAHENGWQLRPRGHGHNWSPLVVPPGTRANVLLVDTTQHLTAVTVHKGAPASVTAQAGVSMESLLQILEDAGYGVTACPAPGDLTLGGVLAIDGHGTAIPARGERLTPGHTFGSISNLVIALTAVVWNEGANRYELKTFHRSDPEIGAFLVHLGRAFITEAVLRVGENKRLRCQSSYAILADDMFAPPSKAGPHAFANLVEGSGRVEAIWFPFTPAPWLKVWSVAPARPWSSREVCHPFNYPFSDSLPQPVSDLISKVTRGASELTPVFENAQMGLVAAGLIATASLDIWGWSKDVMLYVRPTTLRVTANGYAILTNRRNIQRVVSDFYAYYKKALRTYQEKCRYPMNGPLEIRVTGLDDPADALVPGAVAPRLSAVRPRRDHPEWDVAVWLDILTLSGTAHAQPFYRETEAWILSNYTGSYAAVRPEWSKGWGYDGKSAWSDPTILGTTIPNAYRAGQPADENWDAAIATLDAYDPHRVFTNTFLDRLLV